MTALATGLAVFACAAAAVSVLTRRLMNPGAHSARTAQVAGAIAVSACTYGLVFACTGGRLSTAAWPEVLRVSLFGLGAVAASALVAGVWLTPVGVRSGGFLVYRHRGDTTKEWFSPIDSVTGLGRAFFCWVLLPFAIVGAGLYVIRIGGQPPMSSDALVTQLLKDAALAPLWEECVFRWLPLFILVPLLGWQPRPTLCVFTLVWIAFHPPAKLLLGSSMEAILWALPGWCLSAVFYYRVWRGPFFWTSFLVHSAWNVGVIFVHNYLGVL